MDITTRLRDCKCIGIHIERVGLHPNRGVLPDVTLTPTLSRQREKGVKPSATASGRILQSPP